MNAAVLPPITDADAARIYRQFLRAVVAAEKTLDDAVRERLANGKRSLRALRRDVERLIRELLPPGLIITVPNRTLFLTERDGRLVMARLVFDKKMRATVTRCPLALSEHLVHRAIQSGRERDMVSVGQRIADVIMTAAALSLVLPFDQDCWVVDPEGALLVRDQTMVTHIKREAWDLDRERRWAPKLAEQPVYLERVA